MRKRLIGIWLLSIVLWFLVFIFSLCLLYAFLKWKWKIRFHVTSQTWLFLCIVAICAILSLNRLENLYAWWHDRRTIEWINRNTFYSSLFPSSVFPLFSSHHLHLAKEQYKINTIGTRFNKWERIEKNERKQLDVITKFWFQLTATFN